ncbi:unnamed protein product [Closterium sp. NIES-53]
MWSPAPVSGTDQERFFLLVVDDYIRYTSVSPLRCKADVSGVLIPWIRATRHQLRERFRRDLPVLRLHSARGGEFSSGLLEEFCQDDKIHLTFTLPASPKQNGIAERRIGLIMEVARTSMIHAAAPHFLWPFAVRYAAHQLNLCPRVSEPETSPTLWWTGKVGDALMFRVWGVLSLVRDAKARKLSSHTLRCIFLGSSTTHIRVESSPPRTSPLTILTVSTGYTRTRPTRLLVLSLGVLSQRVPALLAWRPPPPPPPPGFPPRPSSPPQQPAAVDSGATSGGDTGGEGSGGAKTEGEGSRGAATGGADFGGAAGAGGATGAGDAGVAAGARGAGPAGAGSPSGVGAVGDPAGGPGAG